MSEHRVRQMGTTDEGLYTVWCVCGHEAASPVSPLEAVDIHVCHRCQASEPDRDALVSDLGAVVRMLKATEPGGPAVSEPSGFRDAITSLETWIAALDTSTAPTTAEKRDE